MSLFILILLAAHEGEEFAIILPAVMLVGAFFVMRWANENDKTEDDGAADGLAQEAPGDLALRDVTTDDAREARQETPV